MHASRWLAGRRRGSERWPERLALLRAHSAAIMLGPASFVLWAFQISSSQSRKIWSQSDSEYSRRFSILKLRSSPGGYISKASPKEIQK